MLDVDRALLDAGAAGRARPEHLGVDHAAFLERADERTRRLGDRAGRHVGELLRGGLLVALGVEPAAGEQVRRLRGGVVAQAHHQQLRRERLAGVPGRALRLAPPALRAGREVEQPLPGEVLDHADAEHVVVGRVLEVDRLAAGDHRLQRPERDLTGRVALEPDVEERREPVPGHAHRRVERDRDQPGHRDHDLEQRDQDDRGLERRHGQTRRTPSRRTR